jgi:two-component system nitrogen regulation sensor histidine kinase NtrY
VTLATRLLLSTLLLALGITLAFAWLTKRTWERAEAERFEAEFDRAIAGLEHDLDQSRTLTQARLDSLCAHGSLVDSALAGLESGTLGSRLLSIKLGLDEERRALGLGELALFSDRSQLVAGTWRGRGVTVQGETTLALPVGNESGRVRTSPDLSFEVGCKRASGERTAYLLGSIPIEPLLTDAGKRHNLHLGLDDELGRGAPHLEADLTKTVGLEGLEGRRLEARRSRSDLVRLLGKVDVALLSVTLVVLGGAAFASLFVARAIARPVAQFAERTRDALRGQAKPLPLTGGRELEQAARAFNQALSDLNDLRERLALTERIVARREVARQVAHEVNNPLMPIRTSIETLRKLKARDPATFDTYFEEATGIVLAEVSRLARLVSSFAAYARLPDPKLSHFDLAALCGEISLLFSQAAEARGVTVELNASGPLSVHADRDQLTQAISNLLKNAIEAALSQRAQGSSGHVWVRAETHPEKAGFCRVVVEDDGPGIPATEVTRLFTPYETTKADGTGLGLPISQRIAVEHGGDLTYASRPSGGATFTLSLKCAPSG